MDFVTFWSALGRFWRCWLVLPSGDGYGSDRGEIRGWAILISSIIWKLKGNSVFERMRNEKIVVRV
jgi:hypothetical protein